LSEWSRHRRSLSAPSPSRLPAPRFPGP
jgi:hypothetical protein